MSERIVYLMRGLPCCGKSQTARRLAGAHGVVCETDAYFETEVGTDPNRYDYDAALLPTARAWNFERFCAAVDAGRSPVIVDRGNSLSAESQRYARYAVGNGYKVELREPDSPWWQEIRVLLKYKQITGVILVEWAKRLAEMSARGHRVPAHDIARKMSKWKWDLTVQEILDYAPAPKGTANGQSREPPPETETAPWLREIMATVTTEQGAKAKTSPGASLADEDEADVCFDPATGERIEGAPAAVRGPGNRRPD